MRSAETSGVGAKGFDTGTGTKVLVSRLLRPLHAATANISSTTLAVGATALLAAVLFVAFDALRTVDDERTRAALLAEIALLAAEPVDATPEADGMAGVWQRGAATFGITFLFIGLTCRRRTAAAGAGHVPLGELIATIPFGIACWTDTGRLVLCNAQYRARVDASGSDCRPGASYQDAVKRMIAGGHMELRSEDDSNRILELHRKDGSRLLIDERPLAGGGFVTLVSDVTERRRSDDLLAAVRQEQRQLARRYHEEKLRAEAASRAKTSFLAHLSHDIRTPLNHIIGFAELMRQETYGPLGDARYRDYLDDMKTSGQRLLTLFASILELAELEGGRTPLRPQPLQLDELLATVARRFSGRAKRAGVALALGEPCGAELIGDRFSLERMLCNIVENAVRFTPHGGRVTLAGLAAADGVVIEISDTGIGMSDAQLELLSQPFAFGDATLTRDSGGPGLGVAIARAIAELSGGRLVIDSRTSLGTTVAISLPVTASEQAAAA